MASTIWKGHITFGLVSIPVKLVRAARAEKVSFRQLHGATGARVRQSLVAEAPPESEYDVQPEPEVEVSRGAAVRRAPEPQRFTAPAPTPIRPPNGRTAEAVPAPPESREISRSEIVKGYEYSRDQYVTFTREELAAIQPQTAREMEILEFVDLTDVDPIYFETSYYVSPDKGGERAYALLFEALRQSGYVALAQIAMHNREHAVVIRPGRHGIVLHTMFYQSEIRETDEYHTDTSGVAQKELDLALLLVGNLHAPFEPARYHDTYREKLDALIQAKISGEQTVQPPAAKAAPVVDILEALQRSLKTASATKGKVGPASEQAPSRRQKRAK